MRLPDSKPRKQLTADTLNFNWRMPTPDEAKLICGELGVVIYQSSGLVSITSVCDELPGILRVQTISYSGRPSSFIRYVVNGVAVRHLTSARGMLDPNWRTKKVSTKRPYGYSKY